MNDVKWIKLRTDFMSECRIQNLRNRRRGKDYVFLWIELMLLAGRINDDGKIYLTKDKPIDAVGLSKSTRENSTFIEKALDLYEEMGLLARDDQGFMEIIDWNTEQSTKQLKEKREKARLRTAAYRKRQEEAALMEAIPIDSLTDTGNPKVISTAQSTVAESTEQQVRQTKSAAAAKPTQATVPDTTDKCNISDKEIQAMLRKRKEIPFGIRKYQNTFGGKISSQAIIDLYRLECQWGVEALCKAIAIAGERGVSHIKYIAGILQHGGGYCAGVTDQELAQEFERKLHR